MVCSLLEVHTWLVESLNVYTRMAQHTLESASNGLSGCDSHACRGNHPDVTITAHDSHIRLSRCAYDPGNIGGSAPVGGWSWSFRHTMGNGPARLYYSTAQVILDPQYFRAYLPDVFVSVPWYYH